MTKLSLFDVLTERNYDIKLLENPVTFKTHGQLTLTLEGVSDQWFVLTKAGEVYFAKLGDLELLAENFQSVLRELFLSWVTYIGW